MHLFGRKEMFVARSLSVLLPVKNAQSTLAPTVHKILDVVSELSEQVELLIIDDGSADATSEVAVELTRRYPQVQAICQSRTLGKEASIRRGLQKSTGDIALIHEEEQGTPLDEIAKALKSSSNLSQFYFRLDAAKVPQVVIPVQADRPAADSVFSKRQPEQRFQTSSRPARPNFLERLKDIVLGE
jgi:glycosyltransferase involved in cell wall biosynthesis